MNGTGAGDATSSPAASAGFWRAFASWAGLLVPLERDHLSLGMAVESGRDAS